MVQPLGLQEQESSEPTAQGTQGGSDKPGEDKPGDKGKQPTPKKATAPPNKRFAHLFKYAVIGETGAGKTALVKRFAKDTFSDIRDYTIGVDFDVKTISLPNGDNVNLQVWDTAGQERFRSLTSSYLRGADAILVVYDMTDGETVDNIPRWLDEVDRYGSEDTIIAVVGSKADLKDEGGKVFPADVVKETLMAKTALAGRVFGWYEASAKTGQGVDHVFTVVMEELLRQKLDERNPLRVGKTLGKGSKGKEGGGGTHGVVDLRADGKKPKGRCC